MYRTQMPPQTVNVITTEYVSPVLLESPPRFYRIRWVQIHEIASAHMTECTSEIACAQLCAMQECGGPQELIMCLECSNTV